MDRSIGLLAFVVLSMSSIATGQMQAQTPERMAKSFQETIEQQRQQLKIPGLTAAVILPDGTTWLGASGKASDSEAMDSGKLFGLASVSMTYIAALVVQLEAEGLLSVDDSIGKWVPDLGQIDGNIPLRMLLNHTSGLCRYQQKPEFLPTILSQPTRIWTPQDIVKEFQGRPECQPGQCFSESAMDYVLLGMVVEKATGSSVSSQLATRFFKPLELAHTYLYPEQSYPFGDMAHFWWDVKGTGEPVDVVASSGEQAERSFWSVWWTSGAIHATAEDLARFTRALFEGRLVRSDALHAMLAPGPELSPNERYGYGVVVDHIDGKLVYSHRGGAGYSSVYVFSAQDGVSISVLSTLMVDPMPVAVALYRAWTANRT
jgi:D-alanyl-D-alanine carboxypeptidase